MEDALLIQLVQQYGDKNWRHIATQIPGRSNRQCRDRWVDHLNPNPRPIAQWTATEDQLLLDKRNQHGSKWDDLVQFFPGKTACQVKYRFSQLIGIINQKKVQNMKQM